MLYNLTVTHKYFTIRMQHYAIYNCQWPEHQIRQGNTKYQHSTEVNVSELYAIWDTRGRGDILWAYKKEKQEKQAVCITPSDAINEKKSK